MCEGNQTTPSPCQHRISCYWHPRTTDLYHLPVNVRQGFLYTKTCYGLDPPIKAAFTVLFLLYQSREFYMISNMIDTVMSFGV